MEYGDISQRDPSQVPQVELYVAGVPCQPWSSSGCQQGLHDRRGKLWANALAYVGAQRPKAVVFENVKGLTGTKFKDVLRGILSTLDGYGYRHWHQVIDTCSHGIPQHRERIYIVAVRKDSGKAHFTWPTALPSPVPLRALLARDKCQPGLPPESLKRGVARRKVVEAVQKLSSKDSSFDMSTRSLVVDIGCSANRVNYMTDRFPTLTASRASVFGFYLVDQGRQLDLRDCFLLQGISPNAYQYVEAGVSEQRVAHMLGNCMSCNVLERLLPLVLAMVDIFPSAPRRQDPWEALGARFAASAP